MLYLNQLDHLTTETLELTECVELSNAVGANRRIGTTGNHPEQEFAPSASLDFLPHRRVTSGIFYFRASRMEVITGLLRLPSTGRRRSMAAMAISTSS